MSLVWSESMSLAMPAMDHAHEELVDQLALVETASDEQVLEAWQAMIEQTAEHFAEEDRWMQATGFAPDNCHSSKHAIVLKIMREGAEKGAKGDLGVIRQMAYELTVWLPHHVSAMDAGLALHLKSVGFNTETGQIDNPDALPQTTLTSCRSEPCEDHAA